ncbi:MAG TPA: DUF488 domain-containing protein [Vicinamibacteria bacterium]
MSPIFTVGHSTRTLAELLDLLQEHGVRELVDVRRYPSSRRHPHFHGAALAAALRAAGLAYRHEPDLGGHRQPLPDSPNRAWRSEALRGYADHMLTPAFQAALDRLRAAGEGVAVMCAEADPERCHRQLLADALLAGGRPVLHILGPGRAQPHALTNTARPTLDGALLYPPRGW